MEKDKLRQMAHDELKNACEEYMVRAVHDGADPAIAIVTFVEGLASYTAEFAIAMSLTEEGFNEYYDKMEKFAAETGAETYEQFAQRMEERQKRHALGESLR